MSVHAPWAPSLSYCSGGEYPVDAMAVMFLGLRPDACRAEPKSSSTGDSSDRRTRMVGGLDVAVQEAGRVHSAAARPPPAPPPASTALS